MSTAVRTERPLTLFERALYCAGRLPGHVTVTACIEGSIDEALLRAALARVQAKHPLLQCLVAERDGRPRFIRHAAPPPLGLQIIRRRSDDDWIDVSARDLSRRFDAQREPLARLTWLRGERRSELVLLCHHAICDGRSTMTLLGEILALCSEPGRDIGRYESLPAFADLLPAAVRDDRRLRRGIRWRAAMLRGLLRVFVRAKPAVTYGEVYREWWKLDEAAAQRLTEQCRLRHVSTYVAIGLAFVLAFRAVCGPRRVSRFQAPVDMRRFLPAVNDDHLFAVAPTITLRPGRAGVAETGIDEFWAQAKAMQADMQRSIESLAPKVYRNFLGMELLHGVFDKMVTYAQSRRAGRQVTLSYLGRLALPQDYHGFRMRDVRAVSGLIGATPAHLVVISRYAECFDFVLASDESSLPRAQAREIRDKAMSTLLAVAAPPAHVSPASVVSSPLPVQVS